MLGHIFFDQDKEMIQWLIDDIIKGNSALVLNSPKLLDHLQKIIKAQNKPGGTLASLNGAIANAEKDLEKLDML